MASILLLEMKNLGLIHKIIEEQMAKAKLPSHLQVKIVFSVLSSVMLLELLMSLSLSDGLCCTN